MSRRELPHAGLSSDINVTPMADIMLVLLIIFMIATPLLQNEISVNLPKAGNPLEVHGGETELTLSLNREGRIFLGKTQVTEQELMQAVSERLSSGSGKSIFLRADQALSYGKVVHIVNQCRKSGVEYIGLMAEKDLNQEKPN